jgi:hypothetical protein
MPDMPQLASKGSILKLLDALSHDPARRQELLNDLTATPPASVADIADKHHLVTPLEKQHLVADWFTNWWPGAQPVEPILREGFRVALTEAIQRNLPMDVYWLCEPGHDGAHEPEGTGGAGTVEVAVCWSAQQVTVLIDTPHPGQFFAGMPALGAVSQDSLVNEPIKVIFRTTPDGPVQTVQPKHRPGLTAS